MRHGLILAAGECLKTTPLSFVDKRCFQPGLGLVEKRQRSFNISAGGEKVHAYSAAGSDDLIAVRCTHPRDLPLSRGSG